MKNRNCPNKDMCRDYNASRCGGCTIGEKITRIVRQNKKLKAENAALRARLEKAVELPRIIHPNTYEWFVQYQNEYGLIFDEIFYSERAAEARLKKKKENNND